MFGHVGCSCICDQDVANAHCVFTNLLINVPRIFVDEVIYGNALT